MIPQPFIQDLLNRIDIVDVIGKYVQLKKGGANFMGLCPFHQEKSPSFTVSPTKQFYHCFGCGAHGSAIGFMMEYSGQSYVEAIRELAQSVGMQVPQEDHRLPPAQQQAYQARGIALSEVLQRACDFYRKQLRASGRAIAYLKGRGLSGEVAAKFGLGYAPDDWQALESVFGSYQVNERDGTEADIQPLMESGLVIERGVGEEGAPVRRYDRFRDRIMFPIRNTKGVVIGFGGRVLDGGEPKYLNSPETPVFSKGNELYGLFEARQAIRDSGYVLVTEGYMDVVALAQLGFANSVATLGTACTPIHVQKLLRQTDNVVFSFDGDAAGLRAAKRALEACLPYLADNKVVRFLFLPAEHDPDSFIRAHGSEAFAAEVMGAMPLSNFLLKMVTEGRDLRQPEGRAQVLHEAKPMLQAMLSGGLRLQIVRSLAEVTGSSAAEVETLCELKKAVSGRFTPAARVKRHPPTALEQQILRMLVRYPQLAMEMDVAVRQQLTRPEQPQGELLAHLLAQCDKHGQQSGFAAFQECLRNSAYSEEYVPLCLGVLQDDIALEDVRPEFTGALAKLMIEGLKREQGALIERMQQGVANEADDARYRETAHEIAERLQKLLGIRP